MPAAIVYKYRHSYAIDLMTRKNIVVEPSVTIVSNVRIN